MKKAILHFNRFLTFFKQAYGHERISACLKRDVIAWQSFLEDTGFHPSTINNHISSLSAFTSWVDTQDDMAYSIKSKANFVL